VGSVYALAAAVPSRASRARVIRLAREFGYDHRVGPLPSLPQADVTAVVPDVPIRVREPLAADGNVTLLELTVLASLVAARRPTRVFEIGTFDGRTALNFAANAPSAVVHTLDLPSTAAPVLPVHTDDRQFIQRSQRGTRGRRLQGAPEQDRIVQLEGDSASFDFSPYAGEMDFVFVDGSHSYEYVRSDSLNALDLAAPGAMIVWHDYGEWEGVTRALNELHAGDPRFARLRHVRATTLALLEL
jgi:predicted O-methyltransferase YrrM